MRKALGVIGLLLAVVGGVQAANAELDFDLMQNIEDTNKSLSSNIALKDVKGSSADARELHRMFTDVEAHFVARGDAPDAVELSRKSLGLTQDIRQAVESGQFDAATEAATNLSRTCRSCHTFYKKS